MPAHTSDPSRAGLERKWFRASWMAAFLALALVIGAFYWVWYVGEIP